MKYVYYFFYYIVVSIIFPVLGICQDSDYNCSKPFSCTKDNTQAVSKAENALYIQSGAKSSLDATTLAIERKVKSYVPNTLIPIMTVVGASYKVYKDRSIKIPLNGIEMQLHTDSIYVKMEF